MFIDPDTDIQKGILVTLLISEFFLILGAVSGIVGAKKRNVCLLLLFTIVVAVFGLLFVSVGIAASFIPSSVFGNESCQNPTSTWLKQANVAYSRSVILCSKECPCNMYSYNGYDSYSLITLNLLHPIRNGGNNTKSLQQCSLYRSTVNADVFQLSDGFNAIESALGCSGWCEGTDNSVHIFSNVNDGKPKGYCFTMLKSYVHDYSQVVMWVCLSFGFFLGLVILGNFCLCCHPERKHIQGFRRFIDDDQGFNNQGYNNQGYQRYN